MPDYSKGKIYCIRSPHTEKVYIGSTIQPLSKRMGGHRTTHKRFKSGLIKYACSSFNILEAGDAYIELIENHPCKNKEELFRREGQIQRNTNDIINLFISGKTSDEIKKYRQEWQKKNKDKVKEYREKNKEYLQEYREKNREQLYKKQNEKYTCGCGKTFSKQNKTRHERSKKHLKWVESQK